MKNVNTGILVTKCNLDLDSLDITIEFYKKTQETLEGVFKTILVPNTWEVKSLNDKTIYIQIDRDTSLDLTTIFVDRIKETLGEGYTIVSGFGEAKVI